MKNIGESLKIFFKEKGLTQEQVADIMGVSQGYVTQLLNGKSAFGKTNAKKWGKAFGLSESWLLTGEGDMVKTPASEPVYEVIEKADYKLIPLINIDSVGGIHSENELTASEQYPIKLLPFTEAREGDVAIYQSGNSMSPIIPPGSIMLIRKVEDWREYFGYGNIYVLWLRDGRRITKEVRKYTTDPENYITCVSYNPDVADEELPRKIIVGVYKVVKYLTDFGW